MKIGAKVKELRVQKGLTQEELADRTELSKALSLSWAGSDLSFHRNPDGHPAGTGNRFKGFL